MRIFRKVILLLTFSFVINTFSFSQLQQDSSKVERELKSVLDEWVQNANRGDFKAMRQMLTDDYFLFQNGRRYTADGTIEMISNSKLSDITFSMNNVKTGSGGNIALINSIIRSKPTVNGEPITSTSQLLAVSELFEKGLLTKEEYEAAKKRLFN